MTIYSSIYRGPARGYTSTTARKKYIAIHNTSNNATASAEASYAKTRTDSVSSHYYVDKVQIIQSLDTKVKAWHAGSSQGNTYAISYEFVGTNDKSRTWWLQNINWDAAAKQIAADMREWGIANRHITVAQMQAGNVTGIVTHDDMRKAWGGTTHNDPGPNFPMDYLISKISQYLSGGSGGGSEMEDNMPTAQEIAQAVWDYKYGDQVKAYNLLIGAGNGYLILKDLQGKDFTDEQAIASAVVSALDPKVLAGLIADAMPTDLAKQVVDELNTRLSS